MDKVVYRHLKPNGEVFYIGIGKTEKRAYSKQNRNPHWRNIVNKYGYEVQILKEDLSWEEAVELECILIDYYGRCDLGTGTLCNMTDGGDGAVGLKHSEETKQKIGDVHRGKKNSDESKLKMSIAKKGKPSPTKGKKMSDEAKLKMSKAKTGKKHSEKAKLNMSLAKKGEKLYNAKKVINTETGVIYPTITEAAEKENINKGTLWGMLNGKSPNKTNLILI